MAEQEAIVITPHGGFLQADYQDLMFSETKLNVADISSQLKKSWGRFGLTEGLLWLKNELCGKLSSDYSQSIDPCDRHEASASEFCKSEEKNPEQY